MIRPSTPIRLNGRKILCTAYLYARSQITHMTIRRIYVDTRLHHMFTLKFDETFWQRGHFPEAVQNGTDFIPLKNPWINGTTSAPFDRRKFDPRLFIPTLITLGQYSLLSDYECGCWGNEWLVP